MPAPVVQVKRGALSNLPGLRAGEPAFTTDSFDFYVGIDSTTNNNKFVGSHRYWTKETASKGSGINLVESTSGSDFITLAAPASVGAAVTYTFPESPTDGYFLKTNSTGTLSWAEVVSTFDIAADSGTPDNVSTGSTITFTGGTNVNTAVTDNTITINLDNDISISNLYVSGLSTFNGLVVGNNGVNVSGFSTIYDLHVLNDLNVNGKLDVDNHIDVSNGAIIAGIVSFTDTTNATNPDNGAVRIDGGVGINKDVYIGGNLNVSNNVSIGGTFVTIGSVDVYIENKDIILGFTTATPPNDDSANHAGVAIASTEGSPLVPFASSGINTLPDTYKQLMWFKSGTLGFSTDTFAFNYGLAIGTTSMANGVRLAVGSGITMSDTEISATDLNLAGNLTVDGNTTLGDSGSDIITIVGVTTFTTSNVFIDNQLYVGGINIVDGATLGEDISARHLLLTGIATVPTLVLSGTPGIGITGISASTSLVEDSDDYLPTQKAVKAYVDAIDFDDDLGIAGDTGTGTVDLDSQSLGIYGTANEIETVGSGTSITIGLPDTVNVTTKIDVPTIEVTDVKARDGSSAITITDSTGAVGFANSVTISGDLYVLGSTTEVNTSTLKVEDTLIDLGLINDSGSLVPPSSDLNLDIGVLFNWYNGSAKKASVFWDDSAGRVGIASDVTEAAGVLTVNNWAAIEIGALWVNDCAGQSQVISCTGAERFLENITIDAGTF